MRPSPSELRDLEVLKRVDIERFTIILKARGWAVIPDDSGSTWIKGDAGIRLPSTRTADYALRIADALRTLELVEDQWAADIYVDLLAAEGAPE